jgi:hypothetical protein
VLWGCHKTPLPRQLLAFRLKTVDQGFIPCWQSVTGSPHLKHHNGAQYQWQLLSFWHCIWLSAFMTPNKPHNVHYIALIIILLRCIHFPQLLDFRHL